jgi:hypothetical protein
MAKEKETGKLYEITRERPATPFEMVVSVGSIGAALGFFMTLVVGACTATFTLDGLLLVSLVFSVTGFAIGLLVGWLILRYLGDLLNVITRPQPPAPRVSRQGTDVDTATEASVVSGEDKGKSVDYVFPELSPDNQQ